MAVLDLEITNGWVVVVVGNCGDWEAWRSGNVVVGKCGGWEMWWLGSVTVGKCGGWEVWWLGTVDWSGAQFAAADAKRKSYAPAILLGLALGPNLGYYELPASVFDCFSFAYVI